MNESKIIKGICVISCVLILGIVANAQQHGGTYRIVDTGQDRCYDNSKEIHFPKPGQPFFGQDAQYEGNTPAYKDNGNGTITDLNTGLMWQKTPDLNNKSTFAEAVAGAKRFRLAGYIDWRLPTIKELYSLIDFRGYSMRTAEQSVPYINTDYFDFVHGDPSAGERIIDAQYWSSTEYISTTMNRSATVFGVNFADGRIKGYPKAFRRDGKKVKHFVRYVRGNPRYGINDFVDNGDGTITDRATGLMWMKADSGKTMNWEKALEYAENLEYAGYDDWRLPNAKELQSIVDHSRSPATTDRSVRGPAIDPIFDTTETESWFWTSTTHLEHGTSTNGVYICFGRAFGYMGPTGRKRKIDVHGAGAQRSDPKAGDPNGWAGGRGPQGDEIRIFNFVRCVRGGSAKLRTSPPSGDPSKYPYNIINTSSFRPSDGKSMHPTRGPDPRGRGGFVQRLDRDGDGKVSKNEFDGPAHHFRKLDRDGDGFLSEDEAPKGPPPGRRPR